VTAAPVLATSVTVEGADSETEITTDGGTLQMYAFLLPVDVTFNAVTWSVFNGTGSATISDSGLLTATGNGTVTVRATAADASGQFGELVITISNQVVIAGEAPASSGGDGGNSTMLIAVAAVAILGAVGAVVYFLFLRPKA